MVYPTLWSWWRFTYTEIKVGPFVENNIDNDFYNKEV